MTNQNVRYERKIHLPNLSLDKIRAVVKTNSYGFREAYPKRQVNSLYYDTVSLGAFFDNELNAAKRAKLRIRWYGDSLEMPDKDHRLEIKIKNGTVGDKFVEPASSNDPYVAHLLKISSPVILVSYQREYFESFDKKFRITLDSDLQYRKPDAGLHENSSYKDMGTVLEIKYAKNLDEEVRKVVSELPGRVGKFSKYARGMVYLYS